MSTFDPAGSAPRLDDPATDPFEVARVAAARLAELTGAPHHDVALVLGSGWSPAGAKTCARRKGLLGNVTTTGTISVRCNNHSC